MVGSCKLLTLISQPTSKALRRAGELYSRAVWTERRFQIQRRMVGVRVHSVVLWEWDFLVVGGCFGSRDMERCLGFRESGSRDGGSGERMMRVWCCCVALCGVVWCGVVLGRREGGKWEERVELDTNVQNGERVEKAFLGIGG